jgi:hypothetical protein
MTCYEISSPFIHILHYAAFATFLPLQATEEAHAQIEAREENAMVLEQVEADISPKRRGGCDDESPRTKKSV